MSILACLVGVVIAAVPAQTPQRRVPVDPAVKAFGFSPEQLGRWHNHFGVDPELDKVRKSLDDEERPATRAAGDQVTISGNFAFTFTSRGPGTNTSAMQTNNITMTTNQQLTLTTSNFGSIVDSGSVARPNSGSVEYEFSIRRGGTVVSGPFTGTDAGANGFVLIAPDPPGASSRTYTLRIRRRITLTEEAKGGEIYTSTGRINLTIN